MPITLPDYNKMYISIEKLRKKKKNLESQKGLLNKFIINDKQNIIKNLNIREKKSLIFVVALAQNV